MFNWFKKKCKHRDSRRVMRIAAGYVGPNYFPDVHVVRVCRNCQHWFVDCEVKQ